MDGNLLDTDHPASFHVLLRIVRSEKQNKLVLHRFVVFRQALKTGYELQRGDILYKYIHTYMFL